MNQVTTSLAKLAGIRKNLQGVVDGPPGYKGYPAQTFAPSIVEANIKLAGAEIERLRKLVPELFSDFPRFSLEPNAPMADDDIFYGRPHLQQIIRAIEQIFEIRAHSELTAPGSNDTPPRVFISHGRAGDWREVQAYIERDINLPTLELAQEANLGRSVLQKLNEETERCTSAVIVMTGDDVTADGEARARENVLHEIGYCQAKFGLDAVCLLHEEGTGIPSNIHGLVYIPFPKGTVSATFGLLMRELKTFYKMP